MKNVIFTLWVVSLLCGGCASTQGKPRLVVLQNLETAEFVDCMVSDGWDTSAAFIKNDECVAEFKKQGYVVWAER